MPAEDTTTGPFALTLDNGEEVGRVEVRSLDGVIWIEAVNVGRADLRKLGNRLLAIAEFGTSMRE